jgi:hypothetical protein
MGVALRIGAWVVERLKPLRSSDQKRTGNDDPQPFATPLRPANDPLNLAAGCWGSHW